MNILGLKHFQHFQFIVLGSDSKLNEFKEEIFMRAPDLRQKEAIMYWEGNKYSAYVRSNIFI